MDKSVRSRKYGIQYVNLNELDHTFISNVINGNIFWESIPRNHRRIGTFLTFIAKIEYKKFKCHSFLPHKYASSYYVFVDIDDGNICMLISTIRDSHQYPESGLRIPKLRDELLYLDTDNETLISLRKAILGQQHPCE